MEGWEGTSIDGTTYPTISACSVIGVKSYSVTLWITTNSSCPAPTSTNGQILLLFHLDEHLIATSLRPAKMVIAIIHRDGRRQTLEEAFDAWEDVGEGFHGRGVGAVGAEGDVVDKACVVGGGDVRCDVVDCVCGLCNRCYWGLGGLPGVVAYGHQLSETDAHGCALRHGR